MKKPKTNIIKLRMIKPLYKKFNSINYVSERLGVSKTVVRYWLGKLKRKPKKNIDNLNVLPEDYYNLLNKVDADVEDPKKFGRQLREEYKEDFGVYPN